MSGPELLVQLSKLFSILSRHTGWMDPVTRATNKPFALLMIGRAQDANLIPAFLVIHNGDGKWLHLPARHLQDSTGLCGIRTSPMTNLLHVHSRFLRR